MVRVGLVADASDHALLGLKLFAVKHFLDSACFERGLEFLLHVELSHDVRPGCLASNHCFEMRLLCVPFLL